MPDETWEDIPGESGICILCARCRPDCLNSTQGWLCRECWRKVLKLNAPPANGMRLAVIPDRSKYGYIVIDGKGTILTVERTLYFFRCESHAEDFRSRMLSRESDTRTIRIQAVVPFLYVMGRPELKMVFITDVQEAPSPSEGKPQL